MDSKHTETDAKSRSRRWKRVAAGLAAGATLILSQSAAAAAPEATTQPAGPLTIADNTSGQNIAAGAVIHLMMGKSSVLSTSVPVKRINVASPDIADVNPIGPQSVLVTAKKPGSTQVIIWDDTDRSQVMDVDVAINLKDLESQLKKLLPNAAIELSNAGGALALKGRVANLEEARQAVEIATPYSTKVHNFLEVSGGQQVMLQVRFAEVSRSATSQLGVNFGFSDGTSFFASQVGGVNPFGVNGSILSASSPGTGVTALGRAAIGNTVLDVFVSALRQNNLLRTLADPNLIAMSGQEASFLAGGEFPVPVPQNNSSGGSGAITVEYKEFGIRLHFTPVVLGDGKIRLKVMPEVSDLDFSSPIKSNGFVMPIINKRTVSTTVEMGEGQTFAIAGLLNSAAAASSDQTPGLSDVPILGALFRSVRYQRRETELVVLVTPRLVAPLNPAQVTELPGQKWRTPTENELFWENDLGGKLADKKHGPTTQGAAGGVVGSDVATGTAPKAVTTLSTPVTVNAASIPSAPPPPRFQGPYGFQPVADVSR